MAILAKEVTDSDPLQIFTSLRDGSTGSGLLFDYELRSDLESLESPSLLSHIDDLESLEESLDDLWSANENLNNQGELPVFRSWETFHDTAFREPRTAYISEGGSRVFDAVLGHQVLTSSTNASDQQSSSVLQPNIVVSSLSQLGLGRESLLFQYDLAKRSFRPADERFRMSGCSSESFGSLVATFIDHGNNMRSLHSFVDGIARSRKKSCVFVALADAINTVVSTVEAQLVRPMSFVKSILQLQALLQKPAVLLSWLSDLTKLINKAESDADFLSLLFDHVQEIECSATSHQEVAYGILAHAAKPWFESVDAWLGLRIDHTFVPSLSRPFHVLAREGKFWQESGEGIERESRSHDSMPIFINEEVAETIFEGRQSLRLLEAHEIDNPLTQPWNTSALEPPNLEWHFSWNDIERVQNRAKEYETNLLEALKNFDNSAVTVEVNEETLPQFLREPAEFGGREKFATLLADMEKPLRSNCLDDTSKISTSVSRLLENTFNGNVNFSALPLSVLSTLSLQPILSAQFRLLSRSTLRLLFRNHSLRSHLRLLHRYTLYSHGPFLTRVSHALFSPLLSSSSRKSGQPRLGISGLNLGARDAWPPASSELRLALMGILTESYLADLAADGRGTEVGKGEIKGRGELPGGLSFAIRGDMSEGELKKCMDPDGLEALDFLKMQYKPPAPLDLVISEECLDRYDRLSRLRLRGARMLFVVQHFLHCNDMPKAKMNVKGMSREVLSATRFRIDATHFVTTVCAYFSASIQDNWASFERKLDSVEAKLDCYEVGMDIEGLHRLQVLHEEVLDRILAECLLRRRQQQVMDLLEEIFGLVLAFAKVLRVAEGVGDREQQVGELHDAFRKKVRVFITVCRALSEQKNVTGRSELLAFGSRDGERGNGIGRLLVALELNNWYTR